MGDVFQNHFSGDRGYYLVTGLGPGPHGVAAILRARHQKHENDKVTMITTRLSQMIKSRI